MLVRLLLNHHPQVVICIKKSTIHLGHVLMNKCCMLHEHHIQVLSFTHTRKISIRHNTIVAPSLNTQKTAKYSQQMNQWQLIVVLKCIVISQLSEC